MTKTIVDEKRKITLKAIKDELNNLCNKITKIRTESVIILQALRDNINNNQEKNMVAALIDDAWRLERDYLGPLMDAIRITKNMETDIPGQTRLL